MVVEEGRYLIEAGGCSDNCPCSREILVSGKWGAKLFNVYTDLGKYIYSIGDKGRVRVAATLEDSHHLKNDCYGVEFTSGDPAVAAIDENGVITALSPGFTEIITTVTFNGVCKTSKKPVAVK